MLKAGATALMLVSERVRKLSVYCLLIFFCFPYVFTIKSFISLSFN